MSSREDILQNIRRATSIKYEKPNLSLIEEKAMVFSNLVNKFASMVEAVGGKFLVLPYDKKINDFIHESFPMSFRIASNLPYISCATYNPDLVSSPADIDHTDLAIIEGEFGVAENGAVWIEQHCKYRALFFAPERIAILLDRNKIVDNMHQAYKRIYASDYEFGLFMAGPSKTSDIEMVMVSGANAASEVVVILYGQQEL